MCLHFICVAYLNVRASLGRMFLTNYTDCITKIGAWWAQQHTLTYTVHNLKLDGKFYLRVQRLNQASDCSQQKHCEPNNVLITTLCLLWPKRIPVCGRMDGIRRSFTQTVHSD